MNTRPLRRSHGTFLFLACLTSVLHAQQNPPGHVKLVMKSDGAIYGAYEAPLILSDDGTTIATDRYNSKGFFGGKPGAWGSVVPLGAPLIGGGTITDFSSSTNSVPYHANKSGQMVFVAEALVGTTKTWGVFLTTPAGIKRLAYDGMPAAGGGSFGTQYASSFENMVVNHPPQISSNGLVLFFGATTGTGAPGEALYLAKLVNGTPVIQKVVGKGDVSPDGSLFTSIEPGYSGGWSVNSAGHVVFEASTTLNFNNRYFYWDGTSITDLPNAAQYNDEVMFNDAGQVLLARSAGMNGSTTGMSLGTATSRAPIVTTTTQAPEGGAFGFSAIVNRPVLNSAGVVAFATSVAYGSPVLSGIWLWNGSGFNTVAAAGSAPGGGLLKDLDDITPVLTDTGLVFFLAPTNHSGGVSNKRIFMGDGHQLVGLISVGDYLEGAQITDLKIGISDTTVSSQQPANDQGQLVYWVKLSDKNEGLVLFTPPARWWTGGSGAWDTAGNWAFFGFTPSPVRDVVIDPLASATITGPQAHTTVRSVVLGDGGLGTTRLELQTGVTLTTTAGLNVMNNGVLGGSGTVGGNATIGGTHDRSSDSGVQTFTGSLNYINTSHLACRLQSDVGSVGQVSAANAVTIAAGAVVDVTLNANGSTVDLTTPFWSTFHTWRLITAKSVTGAFVLGSTTPDSAGHAVGNTVGTFTLVHGKTTVDLMWTPYQVPPVLTSTLGSQLVRLGDPINLSVTATGGGLGFKWYRGTTLVGTTNPLTIAPAALTHAGAYSVKVSNTPTGGTALSTATSNTANIGVVGTADTAVIVNNGSTMTLTALAAAPTVLTYRWRKGGMDMADSLPGERLIKGTGTKTLTIATMGAADAAAYTCLVSMTDPLNPGTPITQVSGAFNVSIRYKPVVTPGGPFAWLVSGTVTDQITAVNDPASFRITGLPAGVTYNTATGQLGGKPTTAKAAGSFTVTASNLAGTSVVAQTFNYSVTKLPDSAVGTFSGLIEPDANLLDAGFGGSLSLTVTSTGDFTGTLKLGVKSFALKSKLHAVAMGDPSVNLTLPRGALSPMTLTFTLPASGHILGTIADSGTPVVVEAWRQTPATTLAGYYTAAIRLPGSATQVGDASIPQGDGYLFMTVASTGAVTVSGKAGDGTTLTLMSTTMGPNGDVPLHWMLYAAGTGALHGWANTTPTMGLPNLGGLLLWSKTRQPALPVTRSYKDGFASHTQMIIGGKYVKPLSTELILGLADAPGNAKLTFTEADIGSSAPNMTFTIAKPNNTVKPFTTNPKGLKLTLTTSTGAFSGSFTLSDLVLGKAVLRPVTFTGALVPRLGEGTGCFQLSSLPTPTTTPLLSGKVVLAAP